MCVSPAELKERAQQAENRQLEVASKKYETTRKKNKQKVSCSKTHDNSSMLCVYISFECQAVCPHYCFEPCHLLRGRAWLLSNQSASVSAQSH